MDSVTEKEILSQPIVWEKVEELLKENKNGILDFICGKREKKWIFIGCGTSYYLALSAAAYCRKITKIDAIGLPASEIFLFPQANIKDEKECFCLPISRSGTTTEVILASKYLKNRKVPLLGISCAGKDLAKECQQMIILPEATEKSVVMTRSFTSMLLSILIICSWLSSQDNDKLLEELSSLPEQGEVILNKYKNLARDIIYNNEFTKFIYLGQGPFYGLACEGALKVKEMSLSMSEAYHSLEFRHGPKSIIDEKTLIIFLMSETAKEYEINLLKDVKKLGAKTLIICEESSKEIRDNGDYLVELNSKVSDYNRLILYLPVLQLIGYWNSIKKGLNPDNPKNLTQVVIL